MKEPVYHVLIDNQQAGPYTLTQLQGLWRNGVITARTMYWQQGLAEWAPLAKIASQLGPASVQELRELVPRSTLSPVSAPARQIQVQGARPVRSGTSGFALASMICGIAGLLIGIPAIPAIICGHIASRNIRRSQGYLQGSGMARIGLVTGYFVIVVFLAVSGMVTILGAGDRDKETRDMSNAGEVAVAIRHYADDHARQTPPDLNALIPRYLATTDALQSPLAPDLQTPAFELMLPHTDLSTIADPANTVLLRGRFKSRTGRRTYIYLDNHGVVKRDPSGD